MTSNEEINTSVKGHGTSIGTLHRKGILDAHEELLRKIGSLQSNLNLKSTTASIVSILQKHPCLLRCLHDITNPSYDSIDPLYSAKHEFLKTKLIDTLLYECGDQLTISSEHPIKAGKLDIVIFSDKILLKSNNKNIAIEIKSGKSIDLFQIERNLIESDVLIVIRLPTLDVFRVDAIAPENELLRSIKLLADKVDKMLSGNVYKVRGEGCRGCTAQCEYRATSRWPNRHNYGPELEFETFVEKTYKVIDKVLRIVVQELVGESSLADGAESSARVSAA